MKVSYKWLQEFVAIDKSPEELAELLTMHAFEVESVEKAGAGLDKVVVGEVLSREKHPGADKLSVTKVKVSAEETLPIVCGAPNVAVGQKVAVALVGAMLPNGISIAERSVRGEVSMGMICAEDELGLGQSHEGIMVLPDELVVGTPLVTALGLDDAVMEVDVLPNRAHDCLCHFGIAREVAALTGRQVQGYGAECALAGKEKNKNLEVSVEEQELCRRYMAAFVQGVTIAPSPEWMQQRLESCGLRPINNIVDITNYIMFSFGQPMHAFDADKLNGKIVVRKARAGETLLALDDKEYDLLEADLVIADENRPIALAGIIGGKETAVTDTTQSVIFEAANFAGVGIRKTAQRLRLFTDSSYRFEREIDPSIALACMSEALRFARTVGMAQGEAEVIDFYPSVRKENEIEFDYARIEKLLGISIPEETVLSILNALGMRASSADGHIRMSVPTYRLDVEKVNDVIEEVARIYGYGNIGATPAQVSMLEVGQDPMWIMERSVRQAWKGLGFSEVYNYSLISEKDIVGFGLRQEECLELKNYLSEDAKFFRTSLIPRLIKTVEYNLKYRDQVKIFELGRVALAKVDGLPTERRFLSGALALRGAEGSKLFGAGKGAVEAFLGDMSSEEVRFVAEDAREFFWHKGRSAAILVGGKKVGELGEIHPQLLLQLGIEERVFCFEIDEELLATNEKRGGFTVINKLPQSEFDLAVVVDKGLEWQRINDLISGLGEELIKEVKPFDIYTGENLGADKKSVAFRVVCQAPDRTLSDEEIKALMEKIVAALASIGGEIRK
jgi:phenylalanyl-tRNA synthetase beta chain